MYLIFFKFIKSIQALSVLFNGVLKKDNFSALSWNNIFLLVLYIFFKISKESLSFEDTNTLLIFFDFRERSIAYCINLFPLNYFIINEYLLILFPLKGKIAIAFFFVFLFKYSSILDFVWFMNDVLEVRLEPCFL